MTQLTLTLEQALAFAAGRAGVEAPPEVHKPANWWAMEREPWKRISADIEAEKITCGD